MQTLVLCAVAGLLLWNLFFRAIPQLRRMKAQTKRMEREVAALRGTLRNK
jgi:hypothetical protein